jgi:hypothetical protein
MLRRLAEEAWSAFEVAAQRRVAGWAARAVARERLAEHRRNPNLESWQLLRSRLLE